MLHPHSLTLTTSVCACPTANCQHLPLWPPEPTCPPSQQVRSAKQPPTHDRGVGIRLPQLPSPLSVLSLKYYVLYWLLHRPSKIKAQLTVGITNLIKKKLFIDCLPFSDSLAPTLLLVLPGVTSHVNHLHSNPYLQVCCLST